MPYLPQSQSPSARRAERVRFDESMPVVLRLRDGKRYSGQLQVVSLTGGLLGVPKPVEPGSIGKLMFLTRNGPVLGEAQMLIPLSWERQAFKFVSLHDDDHSRLHTTIQSRLAQTRRQQDQRSREREDLENFRAW
jgi:hypothetical protein